MAGSEGAPHAGRTTGVSTCGTRSADTARCMPRRSSKPRAPKPASTARRSFWASIDWGVLRRSSMALLWLVLLAGLVAGWSLGLPRLSAYAVAAPTPAPISVTFRDMPQWLSGDPAIDLELLVRECVSDNSLDRQSLVRAREALLDTGWFDSIAQVRRTDLGSVEVVASFAEPAALVRSNDRDWLVDAQGRLLPMSWDSGAGPALAVITNARSGPPRLTGDQWSGNDLIAALAVLAVIDRQPWARQVQAVDVAGYGTDRSINLITDRSSVIRWGRAPGAEKAAEVSAAMKLDFLSHHVQRYGHIDGGLEGVLDVTQDVAVVRGGRR